MPKSIILWERKKQFAGQNAVPLPQVTVLDR
jgi:hypothetical protein